MKLLISAYLSLPQAPKSLGLVLHHKQNPFHPLLLPDTLVTLLLYPNAGPPPFEWGLLPLLQLSCCWVML